jgi:hypothetical protein
LPTQKSSGGSDLGALIVAILALNVCMFMSVTFFCVIVFVFVFCSVGVTMEVSVEMTVEMTVTSDTMLAGVEHLKHCQISIKAKSSCAEHESAPDWLYAYDQSVDCFKKQTD